MPQLKTIEWVNGAARIIDQTKLPAELVYIDIRTAEEMHEAIATLKIRGAPAIGIAASFGLYCGAKDFPDDAAIDDFLEYLGKKAEFLVSARPTAVNCSWAINRIREKISSIAPLSPIVKSLKQAILEEAQSILDEDIRLCRKIGEFGFELLRTFDTLLTHCNAGSLATGGYGTALAAVYVGSERGKVFHVYADETRPLLQGARITAFELMRAGIPVTLICDGMAASVMSHGAIDAVIVGADRIAANGDTANKIGTYGVALAAREHQVPFYVAAPFSTFDLSITTGDEICIEERSADEIVRGFGSVIAPANVRVYNPAFDVTPAKLISGFITDRGVIREPYAVEIKKIFGGGSILSQS